jgi:uncharacterized protein (TIGR03437 family)
VGGLTNGTAYTCSVAATNAFGTSAASSASNSATPLATNAPGTGFTFTGPSGGALKTASGNFTVTPNAAYTGTITITPAGGGLSAAVVLTFSNSSDAQTFTVTPTASGPVTLTPANSAALTNPPALSYNTPPAAPAIGIASAGNGSASVTFTAPAGTGGSAITGYNVTCSPGNISASGSASPITVTGLTNGTAYTCSVTASNAVGTSAPSAASNLVTPPFSVVNAASYVANGLTPGFIGTLFGINLVTGTGAATTLPLPTSFGGASLVLIDGTGQQIPLLLYFVSSGQINFVVPESAGAGAGSIQLTANGVTTSAQITVNVEQPGLFSAPSSGTGPAIGNVIHLNADDSVLYTLLSECGDSLAACSPLPIQFDSADQKIFLSLYGTGFRGRSSLDAVIVTINGVQVPVLYAGPQPQYAGLDQLNVALPQSLKGVGEVVVEMVVDGQSANKVVVEIP